jgi:phospholipid/cholesterol/gamma-HCH transport system ATP-binding protein
MSQAAPATPPKILMQGVQKAFGAKQVLRGVDLTVQEGESLVIIGGSGTGKSVTIKCVLGLIKPDAGRIEVNGENMIGRSGKARERLMHQFGMLFQGGALFDSLNVWQNISFALMQGKNRLSVRDAKKLAIEKLEQVGLEARVADLMPAELSGGMQKRVGLARAIAGNPQIVFFDEPTTGLDPIMADVINDLIVKCRKELGITCMTITHDMASVRKIATKVAMIYDGKILWQGDVSQLDDSGNPYVDQFVHGRADGPIEVAGR